jgi:hypothetical protein
MFAAPCAARKRTLTGVSDTLKWRVRHSNPPGRTMNGMDVIKLVDLCTLHALEAGARPAPPSCRLPHGLLLL